MSLNRDYDAAVTAVADRLRPFLKSDKDRAVAARHALAALTDHPNALRVLLADAAEIARQDERRRQSSSVRVTQNLGHVEAGSTVIGYDARRGR